jgi:hypothetical protein
LETLLNAWKISKILALWFWICKIY